eukprot:g1263.t1
MMNRVTQFGRRAKNQVATIRHHSITRGTAENTTNSIHYFMEKHKSSTISNFLIAGYSLSYLLIVPGIISGFVAAGHFITVFFLRPLSGVGNSTTTASPGGLASIFDAVLHPSEFQVRSTIGELNKSMVNLQGTVFQITAILLQIAASRFTSQVVSMCATDRFLISSNVVFLFSTVYILWLSASAGSNYVPRGEVLIGFLLTVLSYLALLPYFVYLTVILDGQKIIDNLLAPISVPNDDTANEKIHLAQFTFKSIHLGSMQNNSVLGGRGKSRVEKTKMQLSKNLTVVKEMCWQAVESNNETLVNKAVDSLCRFLIDYGKEKKDWPKNFFAVPEEDKQTPIFFSLSQGALRDLTERRTWVEWKVLRIYQMLFEGGIQEDKNVCFVLAVNTRLLATSAMSRFDLHTLDLCIKFFNTFIGHGILQKKVKTVYNILHQYRAIGESLVCFGDDALRTVRMLMTKATQKSEEVFTCVADLEKLLDKKKALRLVIENVIAIETRILRMMQFLHYYANQARTSELFSLTETIAHDMGVLCEYAALSGRISHPEMLDIFLTLQLGSSPNNFDNLLGVRRAQVQLGTTYLVEGMTNCARLVQECFKGDKKEHIQQIWEDLESINEREFWEVNDRGINIDYLNEAQRSKLEEFFKPLGIRALKRITIAEIDDVEQRAEFLRKSSLTTSSTFHSKITTTSVGSGVGSRVNKGMAHLWEVVKMKREMLMKGKEMQETWNEAERTSLAESSARVKKVSQGRPASRLRAILNIVKKKGDKS